MSIKTVRSPRLAATVQTIKPRCTGTLNKGNVGGAFTAAIALHCLSREGAICKPAPLE
jgi:hypothetical protein